jgi:CRISPR/Cas system-associated exonuclease Cas4 (RecB family)
VSRRPAPCGTRSAHERHRLGEPIDRACRDANNEYKRQYYSGAISIQARERASRQAALEALAHRHPEEFRRLCAQALVEALADVRGAS